MTKRGQLQNKFLATIRLPVLSITVILVSLPIGVGRPEGPPLGAAPSPQFKCYQW